MKPAYSLQPIDLFLKNSLSRLVAAFACLLMLMPAIPLLAQDKAAARYEVDAKRIGVNPQDKDALPRSREFIRLDSTYYVGWMYEGLYKSDRSSDYMGYQQAIIPLHKALYLYEKDFGDKLRTIFSSIDNFSKNQNRFGDFYEIVTTLQSCYNSIEMPDSTIALLDKVRGYHFQRDFFFTGAGKAWLYHRNRFYKSEQHPFLKNSIKENEEMAFKECYGQIAEIQRNKAINDYWYGPYQSRQDLLFVYHYLALLHDYNQNYDSSMYYSQYLINAGVVSWSNYGNMQHVIGNFAEAVQDYSKVQQKGRFALNESYYYMPMLLVYGGQAKGAIRMAQEKIAESGSTPGFGWYNIALARGYLYDGQLDSCDFFLEKAANFRELHINTTLTQSLYEFTINLLRIQLIEKKIAAIKFFNTGWWYSIGDLYDLYALKLQKLSLEYALVNALASNPERDRIVYELFCSETTVSYDESMYLLKDFCLPYFEKKYRDYEENDKRKKINRYFRLFESRFLLEDGDDDQARVKSEQLFRETVSENGPPESRIDPDYEKLYTYRLLEVLAHSANEDRKYDNYLNQCFNVYPQLMLFSGMPVKMNITFSGLQNDPIVQEVIGDLEDCNIELTNDANVPRAELQFDKKGDTYVVTINVAGYDNMVIVSNGQLLFKKQEGVGRELAMRLFGKGGAAKL